MKGRALRRALATSDAHRIGGPVDVPLIVDTTEFITPAGAEELLKHNTQNRPINWRKVEEYADAMARGEWKLHAQGIVLDGQGNILTGQTRLWAVIYSGLAGVHFRVSRGSPTDTARVLDRGTPQSARDLASRGTGRRHAPTEASLARGVLALKGELRPSKDALAAIIETHGDVARQLLRDTAGTKKTKAVLLILSAICATAAGSPDRARYLAKRTELLADRLARALVPQTPDACWGRGAAFSLAMERARALVEET